MENLFRVLSLSAAEANYLVGHIAGQADRDPSEPVGQVLNTGFERIAQLRPTGFFEQLEAETAKAIQDAQAGQQDSLGSIVDFLNSLTPQRPPSQEA